jgi:hypothetical protein
MPSPKPLPTIADHLAIAESALVGERDRYGDPRRGALYDHAAGPTAILFAREADRDLDSFRAIYFDDADGKQLTQYVQGRLGVSRVLDTYGKGWATFARPTATAGAGWLLAGSRITVPGTPPSEYVIAGDTPIGATSLSQKAPIRASVRGIGTAVNTQDGLTLEDVSFDPTLQPIAITCENGTDFEPANVYRARARATTLNARNGYLPEIVQTCLNAGAAYVIAFPSQYGLPQGVFTTDDELPPLPSTRVRKGELDTTNFPATLVTTDATTDEPTPHGLIAGDWITMTFQLPVGLLTYPAMPVTIVDDTTITIPATAPFGTDPRNTRNIVQILSAWRGDFGQNAIYVADQNFASTPALLSACRIALESVRVLGADLYVGGIVTQPLKIAATLNLVDDPSRLQTVAITRAATLALLSYFGPTQAGYTYKRVAMGGAITGASPAIQSVTFTTPTQDPQLSPRAWPANLIRYTLSPRDVAFQMAGPSEATT